jgi:type IV pilus assembly protein PilC
VPTILLFSAAAALALFLLFRPRVFLRRRNAAVLCEELAVASRLGVPLPRVLRAFASRRWKRDARAAERVAKRLEEGRTLSEAAAGEPRLFPAPAPLLIAAGEKTGNLAEALSGAARWAWDDLRARGQWAHFLWYPLLLGFALSGLMPASIQPRFAEIFEASSLSGPAAARCLELGRFLAWESRIALGWIPLGVALVLAAWVLLERFGGFRALAGKARLALPVLRGFERSADLERIALVLGMATGAGIRLSEALRAAAAAVWNPVHAEALRAAARDADEGKALHEALERTGRFPAAFAWRAGISARGADPRAAFAGLAGGLRTERIRSLRRALWAAAAASVVAVGLHVGLFEYWVFASISAVRGMVQ